MGNSVEHDSTNVGNSVERDSTKELRTHEQHTTKESKHDQDSSLEQEKDLGSLNEIQEQQMAHFAPHKEHRVHFKNPDDDVEMYPLLFDLDDIKPQHMSDSVETSPLLQNDSQHMSDSVETSPLLQNDSLHTSDVNSFIYSVPANGDQSVNTHISLFSPTESRNTRSSSRQTCPTS
jgi:hypothetical protein